MSERETAADALHQYDERKEARRLLEQAEIIQRELRPEFDLLYSLGGFLFSSGGLLFGSGGCSV